MIKIFRKLSLGFCLTLVLLCTILSLDVIGQSCPDCGPSRTYTGSALELNTNANGNGASLAGGNWSGGSQAFSAGSVARFDQPQNYIWKGNDFNLGGIVLTNGANLTLDRPNEGNDEAFTIAGNCIVVGAGSTLNLIYITSLANVTVCVEDGGKIIFDSRSGTRNEFSFDNVEIRLNGPNAELSFGEAEVNIGTGGLLIEGWTGSAEDLCENSDPPIPGSSGNISWNSSIQLEELCKILNGRILPVEYLSFTVKHSLNTRSNEIKWVTASEKNNSHFVLERSVNDIKSWVAIGEIAGAINSEIPQDYRYTDEKLPLAGGMIYYRLKQVDLEGKYSYGEVIATRVTGINSATTWRVYPNPSAGNDIYLELTNQEKYKGESISLRLLSAHPQVSQQQVTVNNPFELNEALRSLSEFLNKGVAILEIVWGNQVEHIKLIKK
jgi:hypothetical protein